MSNRLKRKIFLFIVLFFIGVAGTAFAQSEDEALRLYNQGMEAAKYGRYQEALGYFESSLRDFHALNHLQGISVSLNNIGEVYDSLGQYEKALSYYEESLKIYRQLNIPQSIATSLNNIGLVYNSLGQYEKALSFYEESLKIYRQLNIPQYIAMSLNNIGFVYNSLGQYEKALSFYEESLKIYRQLNIPQSIATSLNNIGLVYLTLKDYKKAEKLFKEGGRKEGLVDIYIATGRHEEALKLLKDMAPAWNDGDPYRIQFYTQQGMALKGIGRFKEASSVLLKAVLLSEEMRQKVKEKGGFFAGGRIRAYRGIISALSEGAIKGEKIEEEFRAYGNDLASNAFYFSESTKARTLLEAMTQSARQYSKTELPEALRKKEEDILNQLSAIENIWEETYKKGESAFKELVERKERLKKELDSLIATLRKDYPLYAALNYPKPVPPEELPLKDNEVLIEYAVGDDASYIFVVRKGGVKNLLKIPIGREALEEKVKSFMEPMNTKNYEGFSVKEAKGLYDLLLAEVLKEVNTPLNPLLIEGKNIILVPDGILGLLPFEALTINEGKDYKDSLYVGDKYNISYYQSATVLALQRGLKENKPEKTLFALGNPIYSTDDPRYIAWKEKKKEPLLASLDKYSFRGLAIKPKWGKTTEADTESKKVEFSPLPETEIEVKEIARIMNVKTQPPDILLSMTANETELRKTGLEKYKYVHFATHASLPGMIQGINEPFLLLGQVENKDNDDGFLTLNEVLDLKLNSDMVVLSACVTGVGKEVEGEGVANFARAFQHAGTKSVVVSLWEVASDPAVEYMKAFYGHLKSGKGRIEALRLARNEIKAKYPNPFYWAVFILHGEG